MAAESRVILHSFWLSTCSWRVRAALHWKGVAFVEKPVDVLTEMHQLTEDYRAINPAQKVPALVIDGETIVESMAIIRYLEDTRPEPTLTPSTPLLRARMWEICETIVSGIQPLQNVGIKPHFETEQQFQRFYRYWNERGLQTLEDLLKKSAGQRCVGDRLTMADICLVPQVHSAVARLKVDLTKYPTVYKVYNTLIKEKLFQDTHPRNLRPTSKL